MASIGNAPTTQVAATKENGNSEGEKVNGKLSRPELKIEVVSDESSTNAQPLCARPESWDLTLRSLDSNFSCSLVSVSSSLAGAAALSENDIRGLRHSRSRCSSITSSVSETLVNAEEAGILGAMLERPTEKYSSDSLPMPVDKRLSISTLERRSTLTDPGHFELSEKYHGRNPSSYGRTIGEDHANFVLMYDMLTGIRHSVSVCQAKPSRPLSNEDFRYARTYNFLQDSKETTPSKYEFRFKDYCPWVFRSLREAFKIDAADYLVSLTGKYALSEIGSPGKSGSFFYFSQDFRYIIKTIRQSEHEFLRRILRQYYEHIRRNPNSLLTRFYGLHRVRMSNIRKIYFVVMGNVFPPHKDIHETYDLKGSTLGRFITPEELSIKHLATLKDLNWIQRKRNLKLGPAKATILMNQLKADCLFLAKMKIMDYSLLVGIHYISRGNKDNIRERSIMMYEPTTPTEGNGAPAFKQSSISTSTAGDFTGIPREFYLLNLLLIVFRRRMCIYYSEDGGFRSTHRDGTPGDELYFLGVIDILTPYSVAKRIEHVFKSIQHDKKTISAVNPLEYSQRFLGFMAENILQDTESDYATKQLPEIPSFYSAVEEPDAIVIEDGDSCKQDHERSEN